MQGNPEVLAVLSFALKVERGLNMQYRQDWLSLKFMGAKETSRVIKTFGHHTHAWQRDITSRILFLEGNPGTEIAAPAEQPSLTATLQNELALEMAAMGPFERAVETCRVSFDDASRNLFEHLLKWHQTGSKKGHGHIVWLERQLDLIKKIGENDYLTGVM